MYSSGMEYSSVLVKKGNKVVKKQGEGMVYNTHGKHIDVGKLDKNGKIVKQIHFNLPSYNQEEKKIFRKTPYYKKNARKTQNHKIPSKNKTRGIRK